MRCGQKVSRGTCSGMGLATRGTVLQSLTRSPKYHSWEEGHSSNSRLPSTLLRQSSATSKWPELAQSSPISNCENWKASYNRSDRKQGIQKEGKEESTSRRDSRLRSRLYVDTASGLLPHQRLIHCSRIGEDAGNESPLMSGRGITPYSRAQSCKTGKH